MIRTPKLIRVSCHFKGEVRGKLTSPEYGYCVITQKIIRNDDVCKRPHVKIFSRTDFIQFWILGDDVTSVQDLTSLYKMHVKWETFDGHYKRRKRAYNLKLGA